MMDRTSKYVAAVVQAGSFPDDPLKSASKAADLIRQASARGARLAVFPEAFIGGYPKGASFGAPVGLRKPEGREAFRRYYEAAIDLDGEAVGIIAAATAETGLFAVVGCIERDGGTLYCTALFFDGAKGLIGKHRKLMPTAAERLIWGFGDGSTMPVFETPLGRIGAVICWENYMPMLRMHMFSQGIGIYCAPTADDRETWLPSMRHIALEGRCFVLTACQYITRGMYRDGHESALGDSPDTVMMRGGSAIIDPLGRVLAGPDFSGETILYAEIDRDQIARGKFDFDVTGHYARPDVFQLIVDDRPKRAVSCFADRQDGSPLRSMAAK
jgi:nitrilase